jgi:hypothetical protein
MILAASSRIVTFGMCGGIGALTKADRVDDGAWTVN